MLSLSERRTLPPRATASVLTNRPGVEKWKGRRQWRHRSDSSRWTNPSQTKTKRLKRGASSPTCCVLASAKRNRARAMTRKRPFRWHSWTKKKKKRKRKRRKVFGFFSDPHCRPKKMARFLILPPIFMIFVRFKKNDFRLAEGKVSRCRSSSRSFLLFFFRRQFYFIAVVPACFVRAPFFFFFFLFFFFLIIFVLVCAGLWFVLESSRAVTAKGRPVLRHRMKIVRFFFRRNFTHLLIDRQRRLQ